MKNKYLYEIKIYGIKEFVIHILWYFNKDEKLLAKMNRLREKRFDLYNMNQKEDIMRRVSQFNNKRELNVKFPNTFCEKIQWIKINDLPQIKTDLSDKYKVRAWVSQKIGDKYLIPILGSWNNVSDIDFESLPKQFCLKVNHGSGMNCIVKDKEKLNYMYVRRIFDAWMNNPFHMNTLEMQYKNISRKIIAEKYIEEMDGNLYDYKFHCFNGKPTFIQCIGGRDLIKHTGYQNNYDLRWNKLDWTFEDYPVFPYEVKKPAKLDEMIEVAKKLSEEFDYVRVDLYEIGDNVKFGEMTFTPASGIYPYKGTWTREKDEELGRLITVC